jgi:hypothetical protein
MILDSIATIVVGNFEHTATSFSGILGFDTNILKAWIPLA